MHPKYAISKKFTIKKIIYISPDGYFSIAKGIWNEDKTHCFAMRWNGDINDKNDLGYPSRGAYPMWFMLPTDIREVLVALINNL